MSRNSNKFQGNKNPDFKDQEQNRPVEPQTQTHAPPGAGVPMSTPVNSRQNVRELFGLPFIKPEEVVQLPSSGRFYAHNSPLRGVKEVTIRHMTARDEDILSSGMSDANKTLFDKLIDSILVEPKIPSEELLEEDKMAILLKARISGYGPEFKSDAFCGNCGKATLHIFDLSKHEIIEPEFYKEVQDEEEVTYPKYAEESNTFFIKLPVTGIELEILNFDEQVAKTINKSKEQKEKYNIPFNYSLEFMKHVIMTANTVSDPKILSELIEVLPAADGAYIKEFYNDSRPRISTRQETSCQVCNTVSEKEVPLSWALFRRGLL